VLLYIRSEDGIVSCAPMIEKPPSLTQNIHKGITIQKEFINT